MSSIPAQSSFSALDAVPLDAIYNLKELFAVDKHEKKVILGFGFYRDNNSKPWVLPTVEKVTLQSHTPCISGHILMDTCRQKK